MIKIIRIIIALIITASVCACTLATNHPVPHAITWYPAAFMQQPTKASVEGNPKTGTSVLGNSVFFDGDADRIVVHQNPLAGADEFTIEIIIYPNDVYPNNPEPRFFHIESADNPDRRVTMELRLNDNHQWYLDSFIKADDQALALIDATLTHPTEQWAHAAMTFKDQIFTSYVNGKQELSAQTQFLPIAIHAKTSIGARMNKVHWFNGGIYAIHISPKALEPKDFTLIHLLNSDHKSSGH